MDPPVDLVTARTRLEDGVHRYAALLRAAPDVHQTVADGRWTIRETAAHSMTGYSLYTEMAAGAASPLRSLAREDCTANSEQLFADISESDPDKLAGLLVDAAERFLEETAGRPADDPVPYHCDFTYHVFGLTGTLLGETLLHGYDIASRLRRPWRIDPADARLVLAAYAPLYHLIVDPDRTAGLDAAVSIELGGGPPMVARFRDGRFGFEPPGDEAVDATISADPSAFLLVGSGRLDRSAAVAVGLLEVGGPRPEVAMTFPDYFAYP